MNREALELDYMRKHIELISKEVELLKSIDISLKRLAEKTGPLIEGEDETEKSLL